MPRLLIVKTTSLGDVVHNLPVVADIRAHVPDIAIDWVVEENFADIPALHPGVMDIIPVAMRRWRKNLFSRTTWREIRFFRNKLSNYRYDWILDTQGLLKSALIVGSAKGEKHGQDWNSAREPLASLFYRHRHTVARGQHAVTRNRELAAKALGYPLPITSPDYGLPQSLPGYPDLPARYVVGLHGTSRDSKLWPVENWIGLGKALAEQDLTLILSWGNEAEHTRAMMTASTTPKTIVLPRMRLMEMASVLRNAVAAVGVDTGLIHFAAALNIPTVAIYTDTDPALTGVFGARADSSVNLGGIGENPTAEAVFTTVEKLVFPTI